MSIRNFTIAELENLGLPYEDGGPDTVIVNRELHVNEKRWADAHQLVFRHDEKLWRVTYYTGKTEDQEDIGPWGYGFDPDHVEAEEVVPVQVTVTEYRAVDEYTEATR